VDCTITDPWDEAVVQGKPLHTEPFKPRSLILTPVSLVRILALVTLCPVRSDREFRGVPAMVTPMSSVATGAAFTDRFLLLALLAGK
jgi:hypothetical protein